LISRYLVIVLALGAAARQAMHHAWVQAAGLVALAAGLIILQLAQRRPAIKPLAWVAFAVTAGTMVVVWMRMRTMF
jgi:hypothetical protein